MEPQPPVERELALVRELLLLERPVETIRAFMHLSAAQEELRAGP